jgi:phosphatidylglycerol:prolipoprotein diacylglycerol transferase
MPGPFVHRIDPVLVDLGSVHFWWYGLSYALGFLHVHFWLQRRRTALHLTPREAYVLSLWFAIGVLAGGRTVEVAFDEWPFYRTHPSLVPALWLGGMATHGLLIGGASSIALFAVVYRKSFLRLADEIVIPAALLMGLGRIGNFIDGQIVGAITDVPWAVKFPDADGFRHPVVLYDGLKNLLLVPYLLRVRRTNPTPGAAAARFVFWYPVLRIVIDVFRDYPTHRLALGTGQTLNIVMAALGVVLLVRSRMRRLGRLRPLRESLPPGADGPGARPRAWQRVLFAAVVVFALAIPSNWTQDVPRKYAARHPGMHRSWIYPEIDTRPEAQAARP